MDSAAPVLFEESLRGGSCWSHVLKRGTSLRITDVSGGGNAAALFYNFECPVERYNMPDTLKAQHTAHLTRGFVLYSDMGRVLCSITHDTCGWHDPIGGHSDARLVQEKYGAANYQEYRNDFHHNSLDNLLAELAKYGLNRRDLTPTVNFFSKIVVDDGGGMNFERGNSQPGNYVELRAEMNVLVILDTCQHPMDPNPRYAPKPVQISIRRVPPPAADDPCRLSHPENDRGFINTERYFL
jgi:urea carboxylase-associated protein 2